MEATAGCHPTHTACTVSPAPLSAETPDDVLAAEARAGTPAAADLLAARYRARLFAFALAMLQNPDHAEDVAQETLLRALTALPSYRGEGRFRPWLFRIAGNLCRDRRRRAARVEVDLHALPQLAGGSDPQDVVTLRTVVFAAIEALPEAYRGPVALHYMEGLSVAETAAALGRTQTAVRVQLWRARARLAKSLAGWHEEER